MSVFGTKCHSGPDPGFSAGGHGPILGGGGLASNMGTFQ